MEVFYRNYSKLMFKNQKIRFLKSNLIFDIISRIKKKTISIYDVGQVEDYICTKST
jgi:hypothetical protein